MRGPVRIDELVCRQQRAGGTVEDVEETILRCLHQHVPLRPIDLQGRKHQRRRRVEVPAFARRLLVVPDVLASIRIQGDDRGDEQIVATGRAAIGAVPRCAVGGAEVHQVGLRIVGNAVPGIATTAGRPVALVVPGLGRHLQRLALVGFGGIARHGVEAPGELSGVEVVGRHVTSRVKFAATVADHDNLPRDLWRTGDGVGALVIYEGVGLPAYRPILRVERIEDALERPHVHFALPHGDTAVDDVAAGAACVLQLQRRLKLPKQVTRDGIKRVDTAGDA